MTEVFKQETQERLDSSQYVVQELLKAKEELKILQSSYDDMVRQKELDMLDLEDEANHVKITSYEPQNMEYVYYKCYDAYIYYNEAKKLVDTGGFNINIINELESCSVEEVIDVYVKLRGTWYSKPTVDKIYFTLILQGANGQKYGLLHHQNGELSLMDLSREYFATYEEAANNLKEQCINQLENFKKDYQEEKSGDIEL